MTTKLQRPARARRPNELILLATASLLFGVGGFAKPVMAADAPATNPAADEAGIDPAADQAVHKVGDFYKGLKSMSATITADAHVEVQGQKKDSQSVYDVEVSKPNKISFSMRHGTMGGVTKSDGEHVYFFCPQLKMYVTGAAPSDFVQLFSKPEFAFLSGGYSGLSLLEALVAPDPYDLIMQGVSGAKVIGSEKLDGVDTQHLHFVQKELSWDVWIDKGNEPWIRRVVPDVTSILKHYPGGNQDRKMELSINYTDMKSNPELAKGDFAFAPPADAKEVPSFFKTAQEPEAEHPLTNKPAPSINLDTLAGGKLDLSSFKSKDVVVLDFWATWCPPCRRALPILADVTKTFAPKGVEFYAVNEGEDPTKIQDYLKSQGLNINVALDTKGAVGNAYHVTGIPQTVIVGKDGVVHVVHVGFFPNLKERLTSELDAIVAGKEPPAEQ